MSTTATTETTESKTTEAATPVNAMETHGAFSWVEFQGPDAAAARSFYDKVLGWTVADMPMQDGSSYPGILLGDQPIGGFSPKPAETGSWLAYITVDDVDARARAAVDEGGRLLAEPMTAPGVGRIAVVQDPFGAAVALITYEKKDG